MTTKYIWEIRPPENYDPEHSIFVHATCEFEARQKAKSDPEFDYEDWFVCQRMHSLQDIQFGNTYCRY